MAMKMCCLVVFKVEATLKMKTKYPPPQNFGNDTRLHGIRTQKTTFLIIVNLHTPLLEQNLLHLLIWVYDLVIGRN